MECGVFVPGCAFSSEHSAAYRVGWSRVVIPYQQDNLGRTALMRAIFPDVEGGRVKSEDWHASVKRLLKTSDLRQRDYTGMTALHIAASVGGADAGVELFSLVFEHYKRAAPEVIHFSDNKGRTPFLVAAEAGRSATAKIIAELAPRSNLLQANKNKQNVFHLAGTCVQQTREEAAYEADYMSVLLSLAYAAGKAGVLVTLLQQQDVHGRTPAQAAQIAGNAARASYLLRLQRNPTRAVPPLRRVTDYFSERVLGQKTPLATGWKATDGGREPRDLLRTGFGRGGFRKSPFDIRKFFSLVRWLFMNKK